MSEAAAPPMTSNRPYLLRAMHEWIVDNGMTPYLLVDAAAEGLQVPSSAVKDGRVVLNIASRAVANLQLGNRDVSFMARFAGVSHTVVVPLAAVLAVYAQETGQGMGLPPDEGEVAPPQDPGAGPAAGPEPPKRGGHLRIIK
ncbi:MAG TPA: ClpXP protease specificity-enhancing factor [Xanthomonadaceae bacterium]|jgi:stringent starvation protein B|nr:ClpXP protease specificity-enhancing factor [Xanthomonadaceae bacterium]